MKKLLLLLLIATPTFAAERWTELGTTPNSKMWIDENSTFHNGGFAEITEKEVFNDSSRGYNEQITTWKFHCSKALVLQAKTINLLNKNVVNVQLSTEWTEHEPNNISKALAYIACSSMSI